MNGGICRCSCCRPWENRPTQADLFDLVFVLLLFEVLRKPALLASQQIKVPILFTKDKRKKLHVLRKSGGNICFYMCFRLDFRLEIFLKNGKRVDFKKIESWSCE